MKKAVGIMLAMGLACAANASIVVHGSTTTFQETGGDWLSMGANDIDSSGGLGTDGYYFAGAETSPGVFNGVQNNNSGAFDGVGVQPSYITAIAGGASVIGTAYGNSLFGVLDDPLLLNGTNAVGGFWIGTGGTAGSTLENVTFTVGTLAVGQTVRVGVMSGLQQDTNGRWEATSITLSDGSNSATVGDHSTSPLPTAPGGIEANGGWVFFDIDAAGDYTLSGTKRLNTQGVGFSGVTFDSISEPTVGATLLLAPGTLTLELVAPDTSTNGTITATYVAGASSSNDITIVSALADAGFTATVTNSMGLANPNEDITVTFDNSGIGLANGESTNSTLEVIWSENGSGVINTSSVPLAVTYINVPGSIELAPATLSLTLNASDASTNGTVTASFVAGTLATDVEIVSVAATNGFSANPSSFTLGTGNDEQLITVTYVNNGDLVDNGDTAGASLVVAWTEAGSGVTNTANYTVGVTYFNTSGPVILDTSNTASVIDDGTPAWPGSPGVIRAGKGGGTTELIGYAAFDLSAYTSNQLQNSAFTLDYTVSVFAGAATNYPFAVEYIGTYTNDSMPASGTANIAEWQAAPTLASNTVSDIGTFSDAFDLPDSSFGGGAYALFRFKANDIASVPSGTQWDVAQSLTLTVAPDITDLGDVSIGFIPGKVVLSWDIGGTYNVETNLNLTIPDGWGVTASGVSSPYTNDIGSAFQVFYKLSKPE